MTGTYVEELDRDEAMDLLRGCDVVRLAYQDVAHVPVLPVNAVVRGDEVVIRTSYGGKLAAAAHGSTMTVEADELDPVTRTGWVVNVAGPARVVTDLGDLAALELDGDGGVAPRPWAPGDKDFVVAVRADVVTGRRLSTS
ncbi:pyridoxamine 5'-phosphate oxidase family protein [Thalassiella azotivora]